MRIQFLFNSVDIISINTFSADYDENLLIDGPAMQDAIGCFPTAQFRFNVIEPYKNIEKIRKGSYVILTANEKTAFAGVVISVKSVRNGNNKELTIEAVNSFHKLLLSRLNQEFVSAGNSLRGLLEKIKQFHAIEGNITVDDDVDDKININSVNKYPTFLLLTHLALQKDLVFRFDNSDLLWVCRKETFRNWQRDSTPIKVVTPDDPRFTNFTFEIS